MEARVGIWGNAKSPNTPGDGFGRVPDGRGSDGPAPLLDCAGIRLRKSHTACSPMFHLDIDTYSIFVIDAMSVAGRRGAYG